MNELVSLNITVVWLIKEATSLVLFETKRRIILYSHFCNKTELSKSQVILNATVLTS